MLREETVLLPEVSDVTRRRGSIELLLGPLKIAIVYKFVFRLIQELNFAEVKAASFKQGDPLFSKGMRHRRPSSLLRGML
jgi:hypothetical protein